MIIDIKIQLEPGENLPEELSSLITEDLLSLQLGNIKIPNLVMSQNVNFNKFDNIRLGEPTRRILGTTSAEIELIQIKTK